MNFIYRMLAKIFNPLILNNKRVVAFSNEVNDEMKVMFNQNVQYYNTEEFKKQNGLLYFIHLVKAVIVVLKVLVFNPVEKRKSGSYLFSNRFIFTLIALFTLSIVIKVTLFM